MADQQDKLTSLLNASGFAFQLAIEKAVRSMKGHDTWQVAAREYPWVTQTNRGYIDLVLNRGNIHIAIECKRSRDGIWIFLVPDGKQLTRSHARIRWTDVTPHRRNLADWGDIQVHPDSPEADFCVVRGHGEKDTPLLERIAVSLSDAVEGLSVDLFELSRNSRKVRIVLPVIVTTASLMLARFDPSNVDLRTGELTDVSFAPVPVVRFRKSIAMTKAPEEYDPEQIQELSDASERTIFVVEAAHFTRWLGELDIGDSSRPWESARSVAEAMGE